MKCKQKDKDVQRTIRNFTRRRKEIQKQIEHARDEQHIKKLLREIHFLDSARYFIQKNLMGAA